ncbi:MAG: hypothetical protein AVDCRST_MAG50-2427, partial [uncultured Acidimicrobiales bacterium]
ERTQAHRRCHSCDCPHARDAGARLRRTSPAGGCHRWPYRRRGPAPGPRGPRRRSRRRRRERGAPERAEQQPDPHRLPEQQRRQRRGRGGHHHRRQRRLRPGGRAL